MLTRAQCCRVDDQRGLLTKEQLEIPPFLQLPPDKRQNTEPDKPRTSNSSPAESKEELEDKTSVPSSPGGAVKETPDSAEPKSKDLRESTVWKTFTCGMDKNVIKTSQYHVPNHVKRQKLILVQNSQALFKIVYK